MTVRPWKRGTETARAANATVPAANEMGVADGNLYVSDGASAWSALKRLVRFDEVTSAVQSYVLSALVTNATLTNLAAETGYVFAQTDSLGRFASGVDLSGQTTIAKLNLLRKLTSDQLDPAVLARLTAGAVGSMLVALPDHPLYCAALTDQWGRAAIAVRNDGTVDLKPNYQAASIPIGALDATVTSKFSVALNADGVAYAVVDQNNKSSELAIGPDGNFLASVLARWKTRMGLNATTPLVVTVTYHIKPDGTGDFVDPWAAVAAINTAADFGPYKQYVLVIHPGVYTGTPDLLPPNYVTLIGTDRGKCEIRLWQADSSDDATITNNSAMRLHDTVTLQNLRITAKNARYAVHSENAGNSPDATHRTVNCHIEHLGNEGAKTWRTANPGSGLVAASVWSHETPWGYGSSSGIFERFENSTLVGRIIPWSVHDHQDMAKPINHEIVNCRLIAREAASSALSVQSLGGGQSSRVTVDHTECGFICVSASDSPWLSADPAQQVSDHSQIKAFVGGAAPIGYETLNRGKALRITSASTGTSSSVAISGTAGDVIFHNALYTSRAGGGGLAAYAYGYWDISGILTGLNSDVPVNNTLGTRLGDCSGTSKTLTVTIDGGTPINIVFNTNLTAASNASIIATINATLGSAGTAAEYLVSQGETYGDFPDRQMTLPNADTVFIPRWAPLKRGTNGGRDVLLMQISDPVSAFIGVSLDAAPPGALVRVLTSGLLSNSQMNGVTPTISVDTPIYLSDSVAGQFATSGTRKVMNGWTPGWARFQGAQI